MKLKFIKPSLREATATKQSRGFQTWIAALPLVARNDVANNQNGGVFFYIILAIVLLAGLTYVVSQNNRGNTAILTDEQARVAATEIIDYGNTVAKAVQKLKLRGYKDTEIGFGNSTFTFADGITLVHPPGHNANCTSNACEVFSLEGGGLNPVIMGKNSHNSSDLGSGHFRFKAIPIDSIGSAETDLVMQMHDTREEVCIKINNILGVSSSDSPPPTDSFDNLDFNGTYPVHVDPVGDVATELSGTTAHCAESNLAGNYRFHQVLIAR